jgi:hypothetical protein
MNIQKCAKCYEYKYIDEYGMCPTCLDIDVGDKAIFPQEFRVDCVLVVEAIENGKALIRDPDDLKGWMDKNEMRPLTQKELHNYRTEATC